jgi:uncharacterized protein (UPF0264 family)
MIRLLVSVRSVDEALVASAGGADFIDLKEPGRGALGGLPVATIGEIVEALRRQRSSVPISATIGDLPMHDLPAIQAQVQAVGDCGVDYVKVGIERRAEAAPVLEWLAHCGHPVVPVFIADHGIEPAQVAQALQLGFPGLMADTADKHAGSLFDVMDCAELRAFVDPVRARGVMVGLAGALRLQHLPALANLAPDFAGFRSAVCVGERSGTLEPALLRSLVAALRAASTTQAATAEAARVLSA